MSDPCERPARMQSAIVGGDLIGLGTGQPLASNLALHLRVAPQARAALGRVDRHISLLARPQRQRFRDQLMHADHARLGAEDVVVARLQLPQWPQAQRVGREHAFVVVAGDQCHGPLGERPQGLAQVHVERMQLTRQRTDLVDHRRHDQLHRLGQRQPLDTDQMVDRAIEVLGVRAAGGDADPERTSFLAQLLDRVDLAVVAEDRKRLHAPK